MRRKSGESASWRTFTPCVRPASAGRLGVASWQSHDEPSRRARDRQPRVGERCCSAASSLEALAARQPCARLRCRRRSSAPLPLSRAGAPVQPYGVKFGGRGLDARLVTDLSRLEPDRLITPNAAGVRPHRVPGRRRATPRALARQDNRSRSRRGIADDRRAAEIGAADGCAPVRVRRQQQPGKFRLDERGRVGRRAARRRALETASVRSARRCGAR